MRWHLNDVHYCISWAGVSSQIKTADPTEGLLVLKTDSSTRDLDCHLNHKKLTWNLLTTLLQHHGKHFYSACACSTYFPFIIFFVAGIKLSWNKTFHISLHMRWSTAYPWEGWFLLKNKGDVPNFHFCLWKFNHDVHPCSYPTANFYQHLWPHQVCLRRSSPLKHCSTAPIQSPAHSQFWRCCQRRKRTPDKILLVLECDGGQGPAGVVTGTSGHLSSRLQPFSPLAFIKLMLPRFSGPDTNEHSFKLNSLASPLIPSPQSPAQLSAPCHIKCFWHFQEYSLPPILVCPTSSLQGIFWSLQYIKWQIADKMVYLEVLKIIKLVLTYSYRETEALIFYEKLEIKHWNPFEVSNPLKPKPQVMASPSDPGSFVLKVGW